MGIFEASWVINLHSVLFYIEYMQWLSADRWSCAFYANCFEFEASVSVLRCTLSFFIAHKWQEAALKIIQENICETRRASLELLNGYNPAHITLLPSMSLNISNFTVLHYLGCDEKDSTKFLVPKTYIQYIRYIVLDFIKDPHIKHHGDHKMVFKEVFYLLRIVARITKSNQ